MKFFKQWSKLNYPVFTTIRQNKGYYQPGKVIKIQSPKEEFYAEIISIRYITKDDITPIIAFRDADCTKNELIDLLNKFYKEKSNNLILITLMKLKCYG